jgi:hypothetical protein
VCGATFDYWDIILSIYPDMPHKMRCCGARLYFQQSVKILRVD